MSTTASDSELGKAWKAFFAFNHKAKKGRLELFEPQRWLNVVKAVNGHGKQTSIPIRATSSTKKSNRAWSRTQRQKYFATLAKRNSSP